MSKQPHTKGNTEMEEKIEVDAIELKTIEIRINGIKDATQRSRFVFIILTIIAATILIALWNGLLSWDRGMAFPQQNSSSQAMEEDSNNRVEGTISNNQVKPNDSNSKLIADNRKAVREEWFKNLIISVGLLGIRVGVSDLAVIGSLTFIIIMVWFFFSQRRENRAIVGLLRYCYNGLNDRQLSRDVCNLVYEAVVQGIVFIDMGGGDKPIKGIIENAEPPHSDKFIRIILTVLRFLPPLTIFMIVISDIASLFGASYLRDPNERLWKILFNGEHKWEVTQIIIFDLFAFLAGVYTWLLCHRCKEFSQATADTIKEFRAKCCSNIREKDFSSSLREENGNAMISLSDQEKCSRN